MGHKKHGKQRLPLISFEVIPLKEVSGLAVAPLTRGTCLIAVGDHGPDVALTVLDAGQITEWDVIDLSTLSQPAGAPRFEQAEAVAADGHRQVLALIEDPALLLVVDAMNPRITHAYELDGGDHDGLDSTWRDDPSSRGEGMVLLRDGHVLVLKEKRPAGLMEFGPEGDAAYGISAETLHPRGEEWAAPGVGRLVALAWWPVDDSLEDLSDAEIGPDGSLYVLSDQSNAIAEVVLPITPGDDVAYAHIWSLPDEIKKAEGLTFLPDGSGLVAVDRSSVGRNLATLPPVVGWPR